MKVLMFGWEFPPHHNGGLGVACFGITRALAADDVGIILVLPRAMPIAGSFVRPRFAGLEKLTIREAASRLAAYATPLSFSGAYGDNLIEEVRAYGKRAAEIAREESFDIVHAHDWLSALAGIAAKHVSDKPLVFHVHATEFDRSGGAGAHPEVYAIERMGMEAADLVIAVSEYTKKIIVERYGIRPEKIAVLHNGIDSDYFEIISGTSKERRAIQEKMCTFINRLRAHGRKIVLFAGRITLQKGPDYFVELARRVSSLRPNTCFLLAGNGDMERQVIESVALHGLSDKCFFFGHYDGAEIKELYAAADLLVFPSVSEPFGIVPLEAASMGAPVLLSKQSGVSEVMRNVLLVDFWDMDEMVNKTIALLDNPALARTLSFEASRELPLLSWREVGKRLRGLYKNVLD